MNRATSSLTLSLAFAALAAFVGCEGSGASSTTTGTPTATDTASTEPSASAEPEASSAPSAESSADVAPSAEASASAAPDSSAPEPGGSAVPATSSSAASASKYNCGGKGQKACPMQGWMKGVMARSMSSGDNDKIAQNLSTIAAKVPPGGYGQWAAIAAGGAAKAKAGDIDGAKQSCKQCHSLYQKKYKDNQRDQPW